MDAGPAAAAGAGLPWLTWLAAALCVLVTAADQTAARYPASPWRTVDLVFHVPLAQIWNGRFYGLFTSAFVHGAPGSPGITLVHLGFNLLFLLRLGAVLEATMPRLEWLAFFVTAAIVASGVEIAVSSTMPVGVSGVLYAMFGLMWAGRRRVPAWGEIATAGIMAQLAAWGAFCVVATMLFHWPIANAAHAGGFLYGLAAGWAVVARRRLAVAASLAGVLGAITVLATVWMPWSGAWCQWRGQQDAWAGRYGSALRWLRRGLALHQPAASIWTDILEVQSARHDAAGVAEALQELVALGAIHVEQPALPPWIPSGSAPGAPRLTPQGGGPSGPPGDVAPLEWLPQTGR